MKLDELIRTTIANMPREISSLSFHVPLDKFLNVVSEYKAEYKIMFSVVRK